MIKKFRRRFILLAMLALFAVMVLIIGGINVYNFYEVAEDADSLLHIISFNRGSLPEVPIEPVQADRHDGFRGHGRIPDDNFGRYSPETPYETRYFYVGINNETGEADLIETSKIVAVDQNEAEKMARQALSDDDDSGFVGEYRYYISRARQRTYVVFMDCGRTLDSARRFLFGSLIISSLGYMLVFVIVSFLSRYAIRPVTAGYEKQKQFISDAGHELKTPLSIIRADADILEMDLGENEWVTDIRRQVLRMTDLTDALSKLSRMDESEQSIPMEELNFSDLMKEQSSSFEALARTAGMTLKYTAPTELYLRGNRKALQDLCSVLLDNAVKYSADGAEIQLLLEKVGKSASLSVSNPSKLPLPADDLERLFERFYRTDPSRNSGTGGFGIGLAIARAVAESHGGTIKAYSPDGTTLQITVSLPIL